MLLFLLRNAIIHCQGNSVFYVLQICIRFTLLVLVPARLSVTNSFILITSCPTYISAELQVDLVYSRNHYMVCFETLIHWIFGHYLSAVSIHLVSRSFGTITAWMWMQLFHESSQDSYTRQPVQRVLARECHRDGIHYIFCRHCHWRHYRRQFHLKCTEHCVHFNNQPKARIKKISSNEKHETYKSHVHSVHVISVHAHRQHHQMISNGLREKKLSMFRSHLISLKMIPAWSERRAFIINRDNL